jgi:hypothetical protein
LKLSGLINFILIGKTGFTSDEKSTNRRQSK